MARIEVKFGVIQRVSNAGNPYHLVQMFSTKQDGQYKEMPEVQLTPFTARLLMEHLPEFCNAVLEAERQKAEGGPPPQAQQGGEVVAPQVEQPQQFQQSQEPQPVAQGQQSQGQAGGDTPF